MKKLLLCLCMILICSIQTSFAANLSKEDKEIYKRAQTSYSKEQYKRAYELSLPLAQQGSSDAQNLIGCIYDANKDYKNAVVWFKKAAEQNHTGAQYNLGVMYSLGQGVIRHYKEAVQWYTKAARGGDTEAKYKLGYMYSYGYGIGKNFKKALFWYSEAAREGHARAQAKTANAFAFGYGVERQNKKALYWYDKALAQNDAEAQYSIGIHYHDGTCGLNKDYQKAIQWYKKAIKQGYPDAYNNLGAMYYNGEGVRKDVNMGLSLFQEGAKLGSAMAKQNINNHNQRVMISTINTMLINSMSSSGNCNCYQPYEPGGPCGNCGGYH